MPESGKDIKTGLAERESISFSKGRKGEREDKSQTELKSILKKKTVEQKC